MSSFVFLFNELKWSWGENSSESFRLIFLWTDIFILLLFVFGVFWFFKIKKNEFWLRALRQIAKNKMAMVSVLILSVYLSIALLDSIRFQVQSKTKTGEVESLLDLVLHKAKANQEKTYSAPLAVFSSLKETIQTPGGKVVRDYPRLKNAGTHLASSDQRSSDLYHKFFWGVFWFLVLSFLFLLCIGFYIYRKKKIHQWKKILAHAWKDFSWLLVPSAVLIFLFSLIYQLYGEYHIFGTDKAGFDVFYISLKSVRTGVLIGTLTTIVVTPIAVSAGVLSGYLGGWVDDLVQYIYTTLESIPEILLISAAMLIAETFISSESSLEHADRKLLYLCLIMGITSWTNLCRLTRAETLKVRELNFVEAARSFGVGKLRIMLRHILPNVIHIVFIVTVLRFSGLVLAEAVLSYVGIGVDPTIHSWGNMINQARFELAREPVIWWSLVSAFSFMFTLVLPANILADAVRDALDPKLKN